MTTPAFPQRHILVVDDEILSRRAITYALEKAALKSVSVEDPSVALNLATEQKYDLFFLDVQMPDMDGLEATHAIRERQKNSAAHPNYGGRIVIEAGQGTASIAGTIEATGSRVSVWLTMMLRLSPTRV